MVFCTRKCGDTLQRQCGNNYVNDNNPQRSFPLSSIFDMEVNIYVSDCNDKIMK